MGVLTAGEIAELFTLPEDVRVQIVFSNQDDLTIRLVSTPCPHCQIASARIHGQYGRTLATELGTAYRLIQAFVSHLKKQVGAGAVDAWMLQAERSGLPEFKRFAKGIHHDESAVKAAFSLP